MERMSNNSNFPEVDDLRKKRKAKLRLWKEKVKQGQAQVPHVKDMTCVTQKTGEMIKRHDYTILEKVNNLEEEDPLDVYMNSVDMELKQLRQPYLELRMERPFHRRSNNFISILGHAKRSTDVATGKMKKGELMGQNEDGLEYSDEEIDNKANDFDVENSAKTKGKELPFVNYAKMSCVPFHKKLYNQSTELTKMTDVEVQRLRREMEGIKVKGGYVPVPVHRWTQVGLTSKMIALLDRNGYERPTPIQAQAVPVIMSGRDIIAISKTGSGKTLAFLLPLLRHVNFQEPLRVGDGPIAMIMTPTREICSQIGKELKTLLKATKNLRYACLYGGTSMPEQIRILKKGVEIVICTPGRMFGMLAMSKGKVTNLQRLSFLVLDEADRMFDMGLEPVISKIINHARPERQIVMCSATFPRRMEALARKTLDRPIEVLVGEKSKVCKEVEQNVHILAEQDKFLKLLEILGNFSENGLSLIFVNRQEKADILLKELMASGYKECASIHGGIDQDDRDSVMKRFKAGYLRYLIATSVAARGLDVKDLNLVVNYDCPNHYEDYVHRCGRTGRAGRKGRADTFLNLEEGHLAGFILKALEDTESNKPPALTSLWNDTKRNHEAEGKSLNCFGKGYGGSGYKFDSTEEASNTKKHFQKRMFGLEESESDGNDANELVSHERIEKLNEKHFFSNSLFETETPKTECSKEIFEKDLNAERLQQCKRKAELVIEKLNKKLGYDRSNPQHGSNPQQEGDVFGKFEEKIIINDFPQPIRKFITSRRTLSEISDYSDAAITIRGKYFPTGTNISGDSEKLFILIESSQQIEVQKATLEIKRRIKERLGEIQLCSSSQITRGRC